VQEKIKSLANKKDTQPTKNCSCIQVFLSTLTKILKFWFNEITLRTWSTTRGCRRTWEKCHYCH